MKKYIEVKSYNGSLVRIEESHKEEYLKNQEKIKKLLQEGKSLDQALENMKKVNR